MTDKNKFKDKNSFSKITPAKVKNDFLDKQTEKDLADAFAIASNKFFLLADSIYDYEEGSEGYISARNIVEEWYRLMNEYEEKILEILRSEGVIIPETGRIRVLKPFMARNGYRDGAGWWIEA